MKLTWDINDPKLPQVTGAGRGWGKSPSRSNAELGDSGGTSL